MNKAIISMTVRQLMNRPVRLIMLFCFLGFPLLMDVMSRQMERGHAISSHLVIGNTVMFVMIISAGIIGQDVSDGILPLIFRDL